MYFCAMVWVDFEQPVAFMCYEGIEALDEHGDRGQLALHDEGEHPAGEQPGHDGPARRRHATPGNRPEEQQR